MNILLQPKYSKLIGEVNGKFIRSDGSAFAPLNSKRTVNTSELTDDLKEAKNFAPFQIEGDVELTKRKNPDVVFYIYHFTVTEKGTEIQKFRDQLNNFRGQK
jgi:hypothetical protein